MYRATTVLAYVPNTGDAFVYGRKIGDKDHLVVGTGGVCRHMDPRVLEPLYTRLLLSLLQVRLDLKYRGASLIRKKNA